MIKKAKRAGAYLLFALAAAYILEEIVIHLTDNMMYSSADEGADVVRQTVFNAFRFYLLSGLMFFVLGRRKYIKDRVEASTRKYGRIKVVAFVCAFAIGASCLLYLLLVEYSFASLSAYYVKFFAIGIVAFGIFILYAKGRIQKIETMFASQVMLYILLCVSLFPLYPYGGDSATHFRRSLEVSQTYDENTWYTYHELLENPDSGGCQSKEFLKG